MEKVVFFCISPLYPHFFSWSFSRSFPSRLASSLELGSQVGSPTDHSTNSCYPTHQRTKRDEGWAILKQRKVVFKQNQTDSVRVQLCHPAHCVRMFFFQAGFLRSSFTSMCLVKWGRGVFFWQKCNIFKNLSKPFFERLHLFVLHPPLLLDILF